MIGCLGAEFHLAETLVGVFCGLGDRIPEKVGVHEMRAGAGCQKTSVPDQAEPPLVDFPVAAHGSLDGVPRLGEGRRVQDHDIIELALLLERREKIKDVGAQVLQAGAGFIDEPFRIRGNIDFLLCGGSCILCGNIRFVLH